LLLTDASFGIGLETYTSESYLIESRDDSKSAFDVEYWFFAGNIHKGSVSAYMMSQKGTKVSNKLAVLASLAHL
jgi:hypothetical protein